MPKLKQSKKRLIQEIKRRKLNKMRQNKIRFYSKLFLNSLNLNKFESSFSNYRNLISIIDKNRLKGFLNKNKANRLKKKFHSKLTLLKK